MDENFATYLSKKLEDMSQYKGCTESAPNTEYPASTVNFKVSGQ